MDYLTTEARNPASTHLDELTPLELVRLMNAEDHTAVEAVGTQAEVIARAIEIIADKLRAGGRLIYVGAGTSGRLGVLDATECPPTFNTSPEMVVGVIAGGAPALTRGVEGAEDHLEHGERDLAALNLSANDVLVGIATSGRTPFVLGAAAYARRLGAAVIGLVCNADSELAAHADLMIVPVVGPEVLSGSTRLKAGTATKLVLNMLTTGAMVRLGKTYGNLMVDLRATNSKLQARTNRIVRMLTGLNEAEAAEILRQCDGELKTALVSQAIGCTPAEARQRLAQFGGIARQAMERRHTPADLQTYDLVIGIDGGGTRTVALLASADRILGRGEAGPSNLHAVGKTAALHSLDQAISRAFQSASLSRGTVRAICLGLAGAARPAEQEMLHEWAERNRVADNTQITSDGAILLAAGTPEGWGLAIVAGTGSIVVGRTPDEKIGRCGGWGYLLGDEGSGYALVLAALRAIAEAADELQPPTLLTDRILNAMGLQLPTELIAAVYGKEWDRARLAAVAPIVLQAAEEDDAVARAIVEQATDRLARTAAGCVDQLGLNPERLPVAFTGGVLRGSVYFRDRLLQTMHTLGLNPEPVTIVRDPAEGAVRLAAQSRTSLTC